METLNRRLEALGPAIEALMKLGVTPGLSLSVVTNATEDLTAVYHANYGFRCREHQLPITTRPCSQPGR